MFTSTKDKAGDPTVCRT